MPTIAKEIEVDIYQKTYQHPILGDILELDNYIGADISGKPNHQDHDYLISQLNLCKYTYLKEGRILWELFNSYQWRATEHRNFKQYCREYLGMEYWRVKNKINAAAIACELIKMGFVDLPENEAQALMLGILRNDSEEECFEYRLRKVWEQVLKLHPTKRTVKAIRNIIKETYPDALPIPKKRKLTLDIGLAEEIEVEATKKLMSLIK